MKELSSKIQSMAQKVDMIVKLTSWLADTLRRFPNL